MKINELTQAMAEKLVDTLPADTLAAVKFQGAFVRAAVEAGWVEGEVPTLRKDFYALYQKLNVVWMDAQTVPNV
jgi:hypothetical protein